MSDTNPCPITGATVEYAEDGLGRVHAEDGSRCHGTTGKILQIMPAVGWRAVYAGKDDGVAGTFEDPLVGFALVELCNGDREVVALASGGCGDPIDRADQTGNFLVICGPDEVVGDYVKDEARKYRARERAAQAQRKATAT